MKDRTTTILNTSLIVILALSILANFMLFNKFLNTKLNYASMQSKLNNYKVQTQNAQVQWNTIQMSLTDEENKNTQLNKAVQSIKQTPVKQVPTTTSKTTAATPSKPATTTSKQATTPSKTATPTQSQPAQSSSSGDNAFSGLSESHTYSSQPTSSGLEAN